MATNKEHFYYNPRLSFEEFFNISSHIFKISACLKSPLADRKNIDPQIYDKLCQTYDYYEIQYHKDKENLQPRYNQFLYKLSQKYNKPLVATGDSHSVSQYKAECRKILLKAKHKSYGNEDDFDLVIKNYNDFKEAFNKQNALPETVILQAIDNTNKIADQCEEIIDDCSIKYPIVSDNDEKDLKDLINKKYNKPLVATGDSHSVSQYKAECRKILLKAKHKSYGNEDDFDLVIKNYEDFKNAFYIQNALPKNVILEAIENTNKIANQCEEIVDDCSIKYPIVSDNDEKDLKDLINKKYKEKLDKGIISKDKKYLENIREEFRVFKKVNMLGFMLGMAQISEWCENNDIPRGFGRGSCCGSTIAYITDIIDVDPIKWNTIFSRFCNEYRTEVGD